MRKNPGCTLQEAEKFFRNREFRMLFLKRMNQDLTKYYGEEEALKIIELLKKEKLKVINSEIFFDPTAYYYDPALKVEKESKTLTEFVRNYIIAIRQMQNLRLSELNLPLFFIALSHYKINAQTSLIEKLAEELFTSLATPSKVPGINLSFQVLDVPLLHKLKEKEIKINVNLYFLLTNKFLTGCLKTIENPKYKNFNFPKLELLNSIYKDDRNQAELYLKDIFMTRLQTIKDLTKDVQTFTKDSLELRASISILKSTRKEYFFDDEAIIKELIKISNDRPYNTYPLIRETKKNVKNLNYNKFYQASKHTFVSLDIHEGITSSIQSEIEINCKRMTSFEDIENLITSALRIALVKNRIQNPNNNSKMLITLTEVGVFSEELLEKIRNIQNLLKSNYNNEFFISIKFSESFARNNKSIEYLRVISDIHCDVNKGKGYTFNFGEDYVVNCGDTASTCTDAASWIIGNMRQGVVVIGNHLGYNYPYPELGVTHKSNSRTCQAKKLNSLLVNHNAIRVLGSQNSFKFEDINFVGGTLYSDLLLYGEENFEECKKVASQNINDFRRCYKNRLNTVTPYTIEDHLKYFKYNVMDMAKEIRKIRSGPIVVVTHFAPLPYSVAPEYNGDPLTAYFVSDMRSFLKKFPKIRLWCHGHTHHKFDYIYRRKNDNGKWSETRVVCNPFGYYNENSAELPQKYGTRVKIADIKSNKEWSILLARKIQEGEIKVYTDNE